MTYGLAKELQPLLLIFTGNGNVSQGAQEIANELSIKWIAPSEISKLNAADPQGTISNYVAVLFMYLISMSV
jgi:hypothetical protein